MIRNRPFGTGKTGLNSEVVLKLGGLNSDILLYFLILYLTRITKNNHTPHLKSPKNQNYSGEGAFVGG